MSAVMDKPVARVPQAAVRDDFADREIVEFVLGGIEFAAGQFYNKISCSL